MGVGEHHFKLVADGDSLDHVADGGLDRVKKGVALLLLQPHSEVQVFVLFPDFDRDVLERFLEGAMLALDLDAPALDLHIHAFWDLELLFGDDVLHCDQKYYIKFNK